MNALTIILGLLAISSTSLASPNIQSELKTAQFCHSELAMFSIRTMNAAPRYQRHWGFTLEESLEFEALAKDVNGEFRGWEETKAFSPGALPEGGYGYNISIKGKNTLVKGLVVPKNLGLKPDFSKKLKRYLTLWERLNNVWSQTQTDFIGASTTKNGGFYSIVSRKDGNSYRTFIITSAGAYEAMPSSAEKDERILSIPILQLNSNNIFTTNVPVKRTRDVIEWDFFNSSKVPTEIIGAEQAIDLNSGKSEIVGGIIRQIKADMKPIKAQIDIMGNLDKVSLERMNGRMEMGRSWMVYPNNVLQCKGYSPKISEITTQSDMAHFVQSRFSEILDTCSEVNDFQLSQVIGETKQDISQYLSSKGLDKSTIDFPPYYFSCDSVSKK